MVGELRRSGGPPSPQPRPANTASRVPTLHAPWSAHPTSRSCTAIRHRRKPGARCSAGRGGTAVPRRRKKISSQTLVVGHCTESACAAGRGGRDLRSDPGGKLPRSISSPRSPERASDLIVSSGPDRRPPIPWEPGPTPP
jgi:hypothetical protein